MEQHSVQPREQTSKALGANEVIATVGATISATGLSIALATLIFAGPLEASLPRATSNFVLGGGIAALVVGIRSRFVPAVAVIQDGPSVVLVTLAASTAAASDQQSSSAVFVLIGLSSLLAAVAMLLAGHFGVASAVRYMPTTVVGGFIAGTGWLLFKGGFDVMTARHLAIDDVPGLFDPAMAIFWLPGLALGVIVQLASVMKKVSTIVVSGLVPGAFAAFYLVVIAFSTVEGAERGNWLIGPYPSGSGAGLITTDELRGVDWSAVLAHPGGLGSVVAVSLVAVILNLTGIEAVNSTRVDVGHELKSAALASVFIAPLGVAPAFHGLGDTALARQMGARTRWVPIGIGSLCFVAVAVGPHLVGYTPRSIVGGLLVAVGIGLLGRWLGEMRAAASRVEQVLSASIVFIIASFGILEGITFGLVAACLTFVVRYSRINPVRRESNAATTTSRVVRASAERQSLIDRADDLVAYQLTGYIFFGSFSTVADRVRARLGSEDPPVFVLLDFRHVTGLDSSAVELLSRLAAEVSATGCALVLSDYERLVRLSAVKPPGRHFDELEFALEFVEEELLRAATVDGVATSVELEPAVPFRSLSAELRSWLTPIRAQAGDLVIAQGEVGASMYFVLSGHIFVHRVGADGSRQRLRKVGAGAILGEMSLILGAPRTAEVVAGSDVEALGLTVEDYHKLRRDCPLLVVELQDHILDELLGRSAALSDHLSLALR